MSEKVYNIADYQAFDDPYGEMAADRVRNSPELAQYDDLLLESDWNEPDHLQWVATAPLAEILSWAEVIRQDNPR